jgi:hypothetical protein
VENPPVRSLARSPAPKKRQQTASGNNRQQAAIIGNAAYRPEDVAKVRSWLGEMAAIIGMPPPDDIILRQVLEVARGLPVEQIRNALLSEMRRDREKFRTMRSWAFVPRVLQAWFPAA